MTGTTGQKFVRKRLLTVRWAQRRDSLKFTGGGRERSDEENTESGLITTREAGGRRRKEEDDLTWAEGGLCRHTRYTKMPHIVTVPERITDTKR